MITFYSMPKLIKLADNKASKLVKLLKEGKIPTGGSYILNLESMLKTNVDDFYKAEYMYLAAFRTYADYVLLGIKCLGLSYIPDIDVVNVKKGLNPLISTIENNSIIILKKE